MKKVVLILIIVLSVFSLNTYACSCIQGFVSSAYHSKETLLSKHLNINRNNINSIVQVSVRDRDPILVTAAKVVLFPLSIGFYLSAGDCERSCSRESKAVGVLKFRVDYINTSLKRCVADVKIKGKVRSYAGEFKRIKIKTLNSVCER